MMVQETKQATVKGTTAWVTKLSYTRDEALVDKVRAAGAWERGEISSRTLAAIKAHISRRTGISTVGVVAAAPVVVATVVAKAAAPVVGPTIIDASNGKVVEAIEALTHDAFEAMAQRNAAHLRKLLQPIREVWALGGDYVSPTDIFMAQSPIDGACERVIEHRRHNAEYDVRQIECALVERDRSGPGGRLMPRFAGLVHEDADARLLERARAGVEYLRQTMVAKFLGKVLPILAARDDFYGVSQIADRALRTEYGECCFKFWFRDGSEFKAQTMVVQHGEWGGTSYTRYPLTFHKIVVKGEKVGHPCLETAYRVLIPANHNLEAGVIGGLRTVISEVSDEGLMRLLSWDRLDAKGQEVAFRELRQEKRWSGRYYRDEEELRWCTPKRRAKFLGDYALMRQHIEEAARIAVQTLSMVAMQGRA